MKKFLIVLMAMLILVSCGAKKTDSLDSNPNFELFSAINICKSNDSIFFGASDSQQIIVSDTSTAQFAPLCIKPECPHSTSDCNAWFNGSGLCIYNNDLYWAENDYTSASKRVIRIVRSKQDGTSRKTVRTVDDELFNTTLGNGNLLDPTYIFHRGYMFFGSTINKIENGIQSKSVAVLTYPIDSNDAGKLIYQSEYMSEIAVKAYENSLIICASDSDSLEILEYFMNEDILTTHYSGNKPFSGLRFVRTADGIAFADSSETADAYKFTFGQNKLEKLFDFNNGEKNRYYLYGFSEDKVIGGYPDGKSFHIVLKDLSGETVCKNMLTAGEVTDSASLYHFPCGSDDKYIYVWSKVWSNNDNSQFIFAVPISGDKAKLLISC